MLYRTRYQLNKVMLEYKKKNRASVVDAGKKKINIYGKNRASVVDAEKHQKSMVMRELGISG